MNVQIIMALSIWTAMKKTGGCYNTAACFSKDAIKENVPAVLFKQKGIQPIPSRGYAW